jgi:hypothetical protein
MASDKKVWTQPFGSFFKTQRSLGKVWDSSNANRAFEKGRLRSTKSGGSVRLAFRNCTPLPLILCWLNEGGVPHHYYTLPPSPKLEGGPISSLDHIESSHVGHAFCMALCDDVETAESAGRLDRVLGGYRPSIIVNSKDSGERCIHLVTISPGDANRCFSATNDFDVKVELQELDPTPLDTSTKHYEKSTLGGWPVRLEKNWHGGDQKLKRLFEDHLDIASKFLPPHAREELKKTTPFFINKSQRYGPKACPIEGGGMCFHPDVSWLEENGMCKEKCECVEVYRCEEYLEDYQLWGPGGVLLHELCHAYHWKMVPGGYENPEIKKCYEMAMREGLYKCVKVHGTQGPTARAYACENAMEYFAELSVAFLAGKDDHVEYNKWQPFNRRELMEFDPRAFTLLQKIWKVDCSDHEDTSQ